MQAKRQVSQVTLTPVGKLNLRVEAENNSFQFTVSLSEDVLGA